MGTLTPVFMRKCREPRGGQPGRRGSSSTSHQASQQKGSQVATDQNRGDCKAAGAPDGAGPWARGKAGANGQSLGRRCWSNRAPCGPKETQHSVRPKRQEALNRIGEEKRLDMFDQRSTQGNLQILFIRKRVRGKVTDWEEALGAPVRHDGVVREVRGRGKRETMPRKAGRWIKQPLHLRGSSTGQPMHARDVQPQTQAGRQVNAQGRPPSSPANPRPAQASPRDVKTDIRTKARPRGRSRGVSTGCAQPTLPPAEERKTGVSWAGSGNTREPGTRRQERPC